MKIVIIGNSGSGKTWLATRLATSTSANLIHLDHLFWEQGGFDKKRGQDKVFALIEESKLASSWIVEGVFGELAERYLAEAELLVWLDLEWPKCRLRLEQRGSESKAHMDRAQSTVGLAKLIGWASDYYIRSDKRSFQGHSELFEHFHGMRIRLRDEEATNALINDVQQGGQMGALNHAAEHRNE